MADRTYNPQNAYDLAPMIETLHANLKARKIDVDVHASSNPALHLHMSHIFDRGCRLIAAEGIGPTSESSLADALNKLLTGLSCNTFFTGYYLGEEIGSGDFVHYPDEKWFVAEDDDDDEMPEGLLDGHLWDFYDPDDDLDLEDIFDFNSGAGQRGVCALPFVRQRDDETVYFPVNFITNLYADNGTAAGNSVNAARTNALCALCAGHVKKRVFDEKKRLPVIPKEEIARFPRVQAQVERLESEGFGMQIADASLGGIFPVVSVTLVDPADGRVLVAFGAHPSQERAMEQAMSEISRRRGFGENDDVKVPAFNSEILSESTAFVSYEFFKKGADYTVADWDHDVEADRESAYLCDLLHQNGYEVYIADHSYFGLHTCRVIVPQMSERHPVENLVWHNDNEGALYRGDLLSLGRLDEHAWARVLENLEDEGLEDGLKVAEFIGIAPDPGTRWVSLQVGTLKGMLALAIEDYDKALAWNSWSLRHGDLSRQEKKYHRCIDALLEIVIDDTKRYADYKEGLELLYGEEMLQECVALVQSKKQFQGLHFPGLGLDGFTTHQALLKSYKKLQKAKEESR